MLGRKKTKSGTGVLLGIPENLQPLEESIFQRRLQIEVFGEKFTVQVSIIYKRDPVLSFQIIDKLFLMIIWEMMRKNVILLLEAKKRLWI